MAKLGTLSTRRPSSGGSSGGLNPSLLPAGGGLDRLSLAAGKINPAAAQVKFTPAQIPKTVENQVLPALNDFASNVIKATFDYQERESTYLANKAHLLYEQTLRNKYYGAQDSEGNYIPGYNSTTGELAISGYADFQKFSDKTFREIIENLEPRVKAKALLKLQSTRGSYLGKASVHRANELQSVQEQQRYAKQQTIMYDIAADPYSYDIPDPVTGETLKSKFYSLFTNQEDADKAWRNALVDVAKLRYLNTYRKSIQSGVRESTALDNAKQAAQEFVDLVAEPELANSPAHMGAILSDLKKYEEETRSQFVAEENLKMRLADRNEKLKWQKNEAKIESQIIDGDIPDQQEIEDMVLNNEISPEYGRNLRKQFYDPITQAPDPEQMLTIMKQIQENARRGYEPQYRSDGTLIEDSLRGFYAKKPGIFSEARRILRDYENSLIDPDFREQQTRASNLIGVWTEGAPWQKLDKDKLGTIEWQANEEFLRRKLAGEPFKEIMKDLFLKYNSAMNDLRLRGDFPNGEHPMTLQELEQVSRDYRQNRDQYTDDEWERIEAQLNGYARNLEEIARKKLQAPEIFQ